MNDTPKPTRSLTEIENIAKICHEANRAYCQTIGDDSQPTWEDAPQWQRDSAIGGVRFHIDNPNACGSASHENWLAEKVRDGWKFGSVKDSDKKEHPCCVPYEELSLEQRRKDDIFIGVIRGYLKTI